MKYEIEYFNYLISVCKDEQILNGEIKKDIDKIIDYIVGYVNIYIKDGQYHVDNSKFNWKLGGNFFGLINHLIIEIQICGIELTNYDAFVRKFKISAFLDETRD